MTSTADSGMIAAGMLLPSTAERVADLVWRALDADIEDGALVAARRAVVDTIAVALAGVDDASPVLLARALDPGTGPASIWGRRRAGVLDAAQLNGTAAHALDWDDSQRSLRGHPSSPLVSALLPLAEHLGTSGAAVLRAYVVGAEVTCRFGRAMNLEHYERGWHSTATLGTLGVAAATAALLQLEQSRLAHALRIAASMACGLNANYGSMTKALHVGNAARMGLLATLLAAEGFTGAIDALESPVGFLQILSGGGRERLDDVLSTFGQPWEIVDPGLDVKIYPTCNLTHRAIDVALHLRARHKIEPRTIERIRCLDSYRVPSILTYHRPSNTFEARFSLEYALAAALCDGDVGLEQLDDRRIARADVRELMERVSFQVHPDVADRSQSPMTARR